MRELAFTSCGLAAVFAAIVNSATGVKEKEFLKLWDMLMKS